jgi:hypothetical protein
MHHYAKEGLAVDQLLSMMPQVGGIPARISVRHSHALADHKEISNKKS